MTHWRAIAGLLGLIMCQTSGLSPVAMAQSAQKANPPPSNYRQLIAAHLKSLPYFTPPVSDLVISNPGPGVVGALLPTRETTTICVSFRTPTPLGRTRREWIVYHFVDGKLVGDRVTERIFLPNHCAPPRKFEPITEFMKPGTTMVVRKRVPVDPASPGGPYRTEEKVYRGPPAR